MVPQGQQNSNSADTGGAEDIEERVRSLNKWIFKPKPSVRERLYAWNSVLSDHLFQGTRGFWLALIIGSTAGYFAGVRLGHPVVAPIAVIPPPIKVATSVEQPAPVIRRAAKVAPKKLAVKKAGPVKKFRSAKVAKPHKAIHSKRKTKKIVAPGSHGKSKRTYAKRGARRQQLSYLDR